MGREDIANYLLTHGATLDIFAATMLGQIEPVREDLEKNPALANAPGGHGFPPLYYAAVKNRLAIADLLLECGADVNAGEGNNTALHGAALYGQAEFAEWLIQHGAQVNARDYENKTPLVVALSAGHSQLAELLRKHEGKV